MPCLEKEWVLEGFKKDWGPDRGRGGREWVFM